jgi:SpoIID/LytB domain protein
MKKKLCIFIALVLLAGLISVPPVARAEESAVRVLLSTEGRDTLTLTLSGTYDLDGTEIAGGTLTVAVSGTDVVVTHSELGQLFTGEKATLTTQDRANLFTLATSGGKERTYRGSVTFSVSGGAVQAVNTVGMEDYMLGVGVPEVGRDAPEELLKAAMIAAKGYALAEMGVNGSKAYDVDDTSSDQVYNGYYPTADKAIACAAEVSDLTLTYNGKAIKAHYGSSNGGVMLSPKARWGGSQEYSNAYECKFDPFDITRSGATNLMVPVSGDAPETLPEKLYQYLLEQVEAETIVKITDVAGYAKGDHPQGYAPQDGFKITMKVTSGGAETTKTVDVTFDELSKKNVVLTDNSIRFAAQVEEGLWLLCWGQSNGPRVGMSQKGALRMAELGYSYVDILKFYYPNAELKKSDGTVVETHKDLSTEAVMTGLRSKENHSITKLGYVNGYGAQIMSKESANADVCARPTVLSRFGIYKASGDWYFGIDMETGVQGWISKKMITIGDPPDQTPEPTTTPTPAPTDTPEPSPTDTPEPTETAGPTEGPTASPEGTAEPGESAAPSGSPEATEIPDPSPSETPEASDTPEPSPSDTPEASQTPDPSPSETPEATETPEPSPSETPEPTPTPTATPAPTPTGPYTEPTEEMIKKAKKGVLVSSGVNMRKGPGTGYDKVATGLKSGTELTVYLLDNGWYFLKVNSTKKYGYISKEFVELYDDDATPKPTKKPTEEPAIRLSQGDVNGDGLISAADAALILRYDAGLIDWPDNDPRFEAADMDGDDQVTALDAKAILKSVAGRLAR